MSDTANIQDARRLRQRQRGPGNSGDGGDFDGRLRDLEIRLASLETKVDGIKENMATSTDIQALKTLIAEKEAAQTKWLLGILATAVVAITVAMVRLFTD